MWVWVPKDDLLLELSLRQRLLHTSHTIFVGSVAKICLYTVIKKLAEAGNKICLAMWKQGTCHDDRLLSYFVWSIMKLSESDDQWYKYWQYWNKFSKRTVLRCEISLQTVFSHQWCCLGHVECCPRASPELHYNFLTSLSILLQPLLLQIH